MPGGASPRPSRVVLLGGGLPAAVLVLVLAWRHEAANAAQVHLTSDARRIRLASSSALMLSCA